MKGMCGPMRRTFIFAFDDTLAGFSVYNTWALVLDRPMIKPMGDLIPGSWEVLDTLARRGDRLYLYTLNLVLNEEQKWKKINRLGLDRFFQKGNTYMVSQKTPQMFRWICRGRDPDRCYMVGNSYKNDIRPALDAGIKAIYIRRPMLKRLVPDLHGSHPRLFRMSCISQILDKYEEI